mmetsp:Transcript_3992/g.6008  ORF Transcript_3992/g.6008 Transcript_3992/m.6008 type:complete len:84 (+) Transcript_3992:2790-3041(+)
MEPFALYVEGSYFGDQDILMNNGRNGRDSTAVAQTDCSLLVVTKLLIQRMIRKFPKVKKQMKQMADARSKANQEAISQSIKAY